MHEAAGFSRLGAFVAALAVAAVVHLPDGFAQAPAAGSAPTLTATMGPRQGEWKRAFNPFRADTETRWPSAAGIYEPLVIYNRGTSTYLPWLATSHQWTAGNVKLRFVLRPGVVWSDGVPFSAGDVAFTFNLMRRVPSLDRSSVWGFLSDVAVLDPITVEFTFKRPYTPGLVYVGQQPIVSEHKWKDVAQPAAFDDPNPVGTGPFTEVLRFEPTVYELGRNKRYWQSGKPAVHVLRVPLYRSNEEIVRALAGGQLDWASLFMPDIERSWAAKDAAHHLYWYPDLGPTVLLHLNTQRKPFDDRDVRKALSMAIDRPRIMKEAFYDYAQPADATGLAESQKRWKDATLAQATAWTQRDVAASNRLLDLAGLARGGDGVRVLPGSGPMRYDLNVVRGWTDWLAAAEIIRQNMAEVGVALSVKALDYNAWFEALERGRFDVGLWFGDRGPTPYQFYRGQMDAELVRPIGERATGNFHRFGNEEAGKLLRRFEANSDPEELRELGRQLQRLFADNAPSLPLFASPLWGVFDTTRVSGFPTRFNTFASAAPGPPDSLPVLVELKPR